MNHKLTPTEKTTIDKNRLVADLKTLGIAEGDPVSVALSFKSIGLVQGGPESFIEALLEAVGPEGTMFMNAHTLSFPLSEINPDYIFDPKSTRPVVGLVPTVFWKRKGTVRSRHPTCSVVASGRLAEYFVDGHEEHSNAYLPYEKLSQVNGKYLFIGTNDRLVAVRHCAQQRAGLFLDANLFAVRYKNLNGKIGLFVWVFPPCAKNLPALVPQLEKMGVVKRGLIGEAPSLICSSKVLEAMTGILKEDPTLCLCDDILCTSCRETERRLNLYSRIKNPRFFQRSLMIRKILFFRNQLILQRNSRISFRRHKWKRFYHPRVILEIIIRRFLIVVSTIMDSR